MSTRAQWAFIDQVIVSGANFLTGIILVRAVGLHDFGVYSFVLLFLQLLATLQMAAILGPMMSLYEQRGEISKPSYLGAILFHQTAFIFLQVVALCIWQLASLSQQVSAPPMELGIAVALIIANQYQDLVRRFYYVTERPRKAVLTDAIAYGGRLLGLLALFWAGRLTLALTWTTMAVTGALSSLVLARELLTADFSMIRRITRKHMTLFGWMVGNSLADLFSGSFYFFIVGTVLGVEQLGGLRAVQNLIGTTNLLLQALENFVPSSSARILVHGGLSSLRAYVTRISCYGGAGIVVITLLLIVFSDPIMHLVYGRSVADQTSILTILGAYYAMVHVSITVSAGLRALLKLREIFWFQMFLSIGPLAAAWYIAERWGALGVLLMLLLSRTLINSRLVWVFRQATSPQAPGLKFPSRSSE